MSVEEILDERGKTHGDFLTQAVTSQLLKHLMRTTPNWENITPYMRESLELISTKISRMLHGNAYDPEHMRDCAGYAMLIVRELEKK